MGMMLALGLDDRRDRNAVFLNAEERRRLLLFRQRISRAHIDAQKVQPLTANAAFSGYLFCGFFPIIDIVYILSQFF